MSRGTAFSFQPGLRCLIMELAACIICHIPLTQMFHPLVYSTSSRAAKVYYLRYYLGKAANSMRKHNVEYKVYYQKKYNEVAKHQHKIALALTSRKFVRLVYESLAKNQLYSSVSLDTPIKEPNNRNYILC